MLYKFIQALPSTIPSTIASQKDLTPVRIGQLADELMPFIGSNTSVYNTHNATPQQNKTQNEQVVRIPTATYQMEYN